jgi:hypothetical protein
MTFEEIAEGQARIEAAERVSVKLTTGRLVGSVWHEAGEIVRLSEVAARSAIKCGGAVGSALSPSTMLFETPRKQDPAPVVASDGPPNCRITNDGSLFQGGRCYTKAYGPFKFYSADGPFKIHGDLVRHLALQDPVPGSATEAYVRHNCTRRMAKIELLRPLSPDEEKRLQRLRRSLEEPSEKDRRAAKHLLEMAASL